MIVLRSWAQREGVTHFLVGFMDLLGVQRVKLVPSEQIDDAQRHGVRFAGMATWFDLSQADADLVAMPESTTVIRLPWKPDLAWVVATPLLRGEPLAQAPRHHLQCLLAKAAESRLSFKTGVECEFFLLDSDNGASAPQTEQRARRSYDQGMLLRRIDVLIAVCDAMSSLGWRPQHVSHEESEGQFEVTWAYADALTTADRHAFFKMMLRAIAERHNLRATFMPKPFVDQAGSGCHVHMSLWRGDENLFRMQGEPGGFSPTGLHFVGGLVSHANAMAAVTNPTVNSFKRLNAPRPTSGSAWFSNGVSYAFDKRTQVIRILDGERCEFRLPDSAANPYLLQSAILAAGLDGLRHKRNPGAAGGRARCAAVGTVCRRGTTDHSAIQSPRRPAHAQAEQRHGRRVRTFA